MRSSFPTDRLEKRRVLLDAVESVRDILVSCAREAEEIATLPQAAVNAMREAGLFSLKLPMVLGGAEADPVTQIEVIEALARIDTSSAWCMMIGATAIARPGAFLDEKAVEQMFARGHIPTAATVRGQAGEAQPVDGGYQINGTWRFATGIRHSEWLCAGIKVIGDNSPGAYRTAVIPTAKAQIHDSWKVAGLKGTGSCNFSVSDLFVPREFTFERDRFIPKRGGRLYRLGAPGFVIYEHAAFALGAGRLALDTIVRQSMSKLPGGKGVPLSERQSFQHFVGQSDLKLRAARALAMAVYEQAWQNICEKDELEPRIQAEMRGCATYATDIAMEIATQAFRYGGGSALSLSNDLQRCFRDVCGAAVHFMVSESSYADHGQFMLGLPNTDPIA